MVKSMTGYARKTVTTPQGRYIVEIQSVNRKHLEIHTYLPKDLLWLDTQIRQAVGEAIYRGQITLRLSAIFEETAPFKLKPNKPYIKQLEASWRELCQLVGYDVKAFPLEQYLNDEALFYREKDESAEEGYKQDVLNALSLALEALQAMRTREGSALHNDLLSCIDKTKEPIATIQKCSEGATRKYRDTLLARLNELIPGGGIEKDERILKEVALFAEKIDIHEELIRLDSHAKQFRDLLNSDRDCVGKTLEFLLQEMNREINTIGSKSSDLQVSQSVIAIKGEFERIREQLQNIE